MNQQRFLLVDDDLDDIEIFQEVLSSVNPRIELLIANDGIEALKILKSNENNLPQLVFLDLNMPRMGGKECLKMIKADAEIARTDIIMYTTSSQSSDIEETMVSGALCFITKPSTTQGLQEILSIIANSPEGMLRKRLQQLSDTSAYIIC